MRIPAQVGKTVPRSPLHSRQRTTRSPITKEATPAEDGAGFPSIPTAPPPGPGMQLRSKTNKDSSAETRRPKRCITAGSVPPHPGQTGQGHQPDADPAHAPAGRAQRMGTLGQQKQHQNADGHDARISVARERVSGSLRIDVLHPPVWVVRDDIEQQHPGGVASPRQDGARDPDRFSQTGHRQDSLALERRAEDGLVRRVFPRLSRARSHWIANALIDLDAPDGTIRAHQVFAVGIRPFESPDGDRSSTGFRLALIARNQLGHVPRMPRIHPHREQPQRPVALQIDAGPSRQVRALQHRIGNAQRIGTLQCLLGRNRCAGANQCECPQQLHCRSIHTLLPHGGRGFCVTDKPHPALFASRLGATRGGVIAARRTPQRAQAASAGGQRQRAGSTPRKPTTLAFPARAPRHDRELLR
ncbi:Hypothetical protein XCAW_02425 [Xanthomonas citri subsp. citri Aw12879]|nr:Hypothetical protein XCAW_02425 [Xanthomonas citri subsp. citri Aw12879]AUZ51212.1 hypothetical protein CLM98_12145 [Xanthomonas citri pv. citri]AYL25355.1 hypothetical protein CPA10_11555 [Xanthomonas citri pv. citri]